MRKTCTHLSSCGAPWDRTTAYMYIRCVFSILIWPGVTSFCVRLFAFACPCDYLSCVILNTSPAHDFPPSLPAGRVTVDMGRPRISSCCECQQHCGSQEHGSSVCFLLFEIFSSHSPLTSFFYSKSFLPCTLKLTFTNAWIVVHAVTALVHHSISTALQILFFIKKKRTFLTKDLIIIRSILCGFSYGCMLFERHCQDSTGYWYSWLYYFQSVHAQCRSVRSRRDIF